jgi:hypothetical protein
MPDYYRKAARESYRKLRQEILDHYGHACVCCGVTGDLFLAVDHINNDGGDHRRALSNTKAGTTYVYRALRRLGFPQEGFQVLCHNCNSAKHLNGGVCPHQVTRAEEAAS